MKGLSNAGLRNMRRLARILVLSLMISSVGVGLLHTYRWARTSELFQLDEVDYQGLVHLKKETLDLLLLKTLPHNLLQVDLDRVRELAESESWVQEARVRRKLPNRLVVSVAERQPMAVAAIDGELYVVDSQGIVLAAYGSTYHWIDRPIVKGLKNIARENARVENSRKMEIYLQVLHDLNSPREDHNRSISEIDLQDPERVAVIPDNDPVLIYLGNRNFLARYEVFLSQLDLYQRLKEQYGLIESVDLTYDDKIIFHTGEDKERTVSTGRQS